MGRRHGSLPWGNLSVGIGENVGTHWFPYVFCGSDTVGQQLAATSLTAIRRAKLSIAFSSPFIKDFHVLCLTNHFVFFFP